MKNGASTHARKVEVEVEVEEERGSGIGKQLIDTVDSEAKSRNCKHCWLDTFSFQAAGFYEKLDYNKLGRLENYLAGHQRYFYFKELV